MKLRTIAAMLILPALMAAASCSTQYGKMGIMGGGGYVDRQVDSSTFIVRFEGNSYTDREDVEAYLLYRCANITVEQGGDYFVLVEHDYERPSATAIIRVCKGMPPADEYRAFDASDVIAHLRSSL
jgi:hypothetical protein